MLKNVRITFQFSEKSHQTRYHVGFQKIWVFWFEEEKLWVVQFVGIL